MQVFSIDECFLKFTDLKREEAVELSYKIKDGVKEMFGYTVNIGVSENKLLAKQAGDLEKPDKCHTIFPDEIKEKLWVLPVEDLFMVGRRTKPKLNRWGIYTIGDLAASDYNFISTMLKSHGRMIYNYAWGRDDSVFKEKAPIKSVGNSSTLKFNVDNRETAHVILLSLTEMTALRLREANMNCRVVSVSIKDNIKQINFFQDELSIKNEILDKAVDKIRIKYGDEAVIRGVFANSDLRPILGGYPDDEYPGMGSIL
ncbi:MAG: polymerase [Sedimentibacter sp.]|nr:polymerase [Sedimentibacter sp.]